MSRKNARKNARKTQQSQASSSSSVRSSVSSASTAPTTSSETSTGLSRRPSSPTHLEVPIKENLKPRQTPHRRWMPQPCRWWPCRAIQPYVQGITIFLKRLVSPAWHDYLLVVLVLGVMLSGFWVAIEGLLSMVKLAAAQDTDCSIVYVTIPGPVITVSLIASTPPTLSTITSIGVPYTSGWVTPSTFVSPSPYLSTSGMPIGSSSSTADSLPLSNLPPTSGPPAPSLPPPAPSSIVPAPGLPLTWSVSTSTTSSPTLDGSSPTPSPPALNQPATTTIWQELTLTSTWSLMSILPDASTGSESHFTLSLPEPSSQPSTIPWSRYSDSTPLPISSSVLSIGSSSFATITMSTRRESWITTSDMWSDTTMMTTTSFLNPTSIVSSISVSKLPSSGWSSTVAGNVPTKVISVGNTAFSFVFSAPIITTTVSYWTGLYPSASGRDATDILSLENITRSIRQTAAVLPSFEVLKPGPAASALHTYTTVAEGVTHTVVAAAAETAVCGEYGNFSLTFDDTSVGPAKDDILPVNGLTNPYHHLFYANGYTYVPDKWEPYPAISQPNVAMLLPFGGLLPNTRFAGTLLPGEIGAGPRASVSAYWFNAYSGWFGCALNGVTPCTLRISGYRYDATQQQEVVVVEQKVTIPACYGYIKCRLTQVVFNEQFTALSGIQFNAYTYNLGIPQIHMMDSLQMEWYNSTCAAGLLRMGHRW